MSFPLLEAAGLEKSFAAGRTKAVDGVSFSIAAGETLGLVGESGCGKTTLGRLVIGVLEPSAGSLFFRGADTAGFGRAELAAYRRRVQMIWQDPYASLNPSFRVREVLEEPLIIHRLMRTRRERMEAAARALAAVRLEPAADFMDRFPHMLSGGQRQRVAMARALLLEPELVVADEPVSMIDLSTRAEILSMMKELRSRFGLSFLYITHDLSTARLFADRLAVMYLGRLVETGPARELLEAPRHPYTRALIAAVCEPAPGRVELPKRLPILGELPSAARVPPGCRFHPRCPFAEAACRAAPEPELEAAGDAGGRVACRRWREL